MRFLTAAVLLAALTACGGSSENAGAAEPTAPATEVTSVELAPSCEAISDALSGVDPYDQVQMRSFVDRFVEIQNAADDQARAALNPIADPAVALVNGAGLDAHKQFIDAIDALADDCRAVGSTALD